MSEDPGKAIIRASEQTGVVQKPASRSLWNRVRGTFGFGGLSPDDGAMLLAYETLGDLLARRFDSYGGPALAAASAGIIDPEARTVFDHLSAGAEWSRIEAAAHELRAALHHVTAEYLQPELSGSPWRLKIDAAVIVGGKTSKASLTRKLDWAELPDIVRETYMREKRDTYLLTLVALPDAGKR